MWVITTTGFYSAVATPDGQMMVRGRVADDLTALAAAIPSHPDVIETMHADYPFRVLCPPAEWAAFLAAEAMAVDYPNFKAAVDARQGEERHGVYAGVWGVLRRLEALWYDE